MAGFAAVVAFALYPVRGMAIEKATLTDYPLGFAIELVGELAAMLKLGMGHAAGCAKHDQVFSMSSVNLAAGACNQLGLLLTHRS
jgi:hypothetical protein